MGTETTKTIIYSIIAASISAVATLLLIGDNHKDLDWETLLAALVALAAAVGASKPNSI